jgi:hypothetical protein
MGGDATLPICVCCHDDKDRTIVGNWEPSTAFASLASLWGKCDRDERLMLAKMFHVCSQGTAAIDAKAK